MIVTHGWYESAQTQLSLGSTSRGVVRFIIRADLCVQHAPSTWRAISFQTAGAQVQAAAGACQMSFMR